MQDLISCEEPILARVKLTIRVLAEVLLQILFHRCSVSRHLNHRVKMRLERGETTLRFVVRFQTVILLALSLEVVL